MKKTAQLLLVLSFLFQVSSFVVGSSKLQSVPSLRLSCSINSGLKMCTAAASDSQTILKKDDTNITRKFKKALKVIYKFSRPHTIKGTILASVMGVTRALMENPTKITISLIPRAFLGLLALLCGNAYIVGINQIYDVKIDEINKPFLPIAAKQLSTNSAWILILSCLLTGVSIVKTQFSPQIFGLYMVGVVLGSIYSIPPLQFKRIPILAGSIIAVVRGFLLNFGIYYAIREALSIPFQWNPVVVFISSFMTLFASVIAVTKDLPDIEGDKKYNISTFASTYGVKTLATAAAIALSTTYSVAIILPLILKQTFNKIPMMLGHSLFLVYFLKNYFAMDPTNMTSIKGFYKVIWNLFYMEYLLYPFI